jgi:predicted acyltransferase (DUF342 family)
MDQNEYLPDLEGDYSCKFVISHLFTAEDKSISNKDIDIGSYVTITTGSVSDGDTEIQKIANVITVF